MRLPTWKLIALPVALAFFFAFPAVDAARLQPSFEGDGRPDCAGHGYPFLKWLRDSAVEVIFGKPSVRAKSSGPDAVLQSLYRNDIVVRFNVTTSEEESALATAAQQMFLDVWAFTPEYVDVRINKDDVAPLLTLLPNSLQPSVLIPDVAAAVWRAYPSTAAEKPQFESSMADTRKMRTTLDGMGNVFFSNYQRLPVITSWMRLLEAMFPSITQMITIGKSYEGRDIHAMRVSAQGDGSQIKRPRQTILITGGLHGREWITTSTVSYLLWSVITLYEKEPMITRLLQRFDIVFIPALNPDGYEYTWQTNRLWRKSRQQTKLRFCRGLDLDHAFGYAWDAAQHQTDPCSESYGGEQPFQAVEASELAKWAKNETENGAKFVAFLDLHSYSQQILFPYAYTCSVDPPNLENLEELAIGLAKAIRLSSGETYSAMSACEGAVARTDSAGDILPRIEAGGGSAIDWFYHELHTRYSYQIKLRDTGSYGFLLPSENIVPTGEETLNALKYLGDYLLGNNGIEKYPIQPSSEEWRELKRRKEWEG
ncbi:Putative metallocarboxypeptidase ecm14 [Madurella fahalii]|uniref:Inactive metallocarboxypeptidase ECM14 n=1 Tax=Madurella fahalii TaxID=1157608 RepID=A0ABQ0G996_9PEZI